VGELNDPEENGGDEGRGGDGEDPGPDDAAGENSLV
jgi:hypothetical protein